MQTRGSRVAVVLGGALLLLGACRSGPEAAAGVLRPEADAGSPPATASAAAQTPAAVEAAPAMATAAAPRTGADAGGLHVAPGKRRAAAATAPPGATAGASTAACTLDADCELSLREERGCCTTLCVPRAVSVAQHAEEARACQGFDADRCASPACAPPPWRYSAACRAGVCTVERSPVEGRP